MDKKRSGGVSWVKPAEPAFLKKFKTDVGYKEGPNVDTKRQVISMPEDDSGSDREDERPQVIVLKDGDVSAEVKMIKDGKVGGAAEKDEKDGKILFKKPAKRSSAEKFQGISASSSKKKEDKGGEKEGGEKKAGKKIKNISLLSFGGDEEEEED